MRLPLFKNRQVPEDEPLFRDAESALQSRISDFWEGMRGGVTYSPRLLENVWVANRCLQLNSQQIASMPLRFIGSSQPAWVTNPDPAWYPNGIGDAVFAAVASMYGHGDAFLYVTARYANGLPSAWTVLDPVPVSVEVKNGVRFYRSGTRWLNRDDVVQISRNPGNSIRGTSALRSYASYLHGLQSSSELARSLMGEGATPNAVLKSQKKLTKDQAETLQQQWADATAVRRGYPAVLPPEIDFEQLAFSPKDLLLLDAQEFNARVIASAFNVPAFMLNLPLEGGLTYQNPEILFDFWWRAELRPAAQRISDALTAQMLPRGSSVQFDAREVLAPGLKDMHTIWKEALQEEVVTPDEYRRAVLQLGPMGDRAAIDELLQPNVADASPADQPDSSSVIALRPSQAVT